MAIAVEVIEASSRDDVDGVKIRVQRNDNDTGRGRADQLGTLASTMTEN
jgi:hypothetical protein